MAYIRALSSSSGGGGSDTELLYYKGGCRKDTSSTYLTIPNKGEYFVLFIFATSGNSLYVSSGGTATQIQSSSISWHTSTYYFKTYKLVTTSTNVSLAGTTAAGTTNIYVFNAD